MTDPISDFLTRLRNASKAPPRGLPAPYSKVKEGLAAILKAEGYISDYIDRHGRTRPQDPHRKAQVRRQRPRHHRHPAHEHPGRRLYCRCGEIPLVLNGSRHLDSFHIQGLLRDQDCRRGKHGGELICNVW